MNNRIIVLSMTIATMLAHPFLSGDDKKLVSPLPPAAVQNGDTDDSQEDLDEDEGVYEDTDEDEDELT